MTGKISEDPDKVVAGNEKFAAAVGGNNYGILGSSIATYLASLAQTLTSKTINAASNTISNLSTAMFAAGVVDTDGTLAANSDNKIASQKAVKTAVDAAKTYADGLVAAQDAMVFKGVTDCSANPNYPAADRGHTYRVSVAGKIGGASGVVVEIGDMFICLTDGTAAGNQAAVGTNWSVIQTNIDGAVVGPASSTSGNIATFSGTSGKIVQDAGTAVSDLVAKSTLTTRGDIFLRGASVIARLALGAAGYALKSDGTDAVWAPSRDVLSAARIYYVRTDGSDSNNGLANTSGGAFLTVQKAIDVVAGLDMSIYQVTIQVGAGTYTGQMLLKNWLGALRPVIQGDTTTPANVIISTAGNCVNADGTMAWTVQGFRLTSSGGGCIQTANGGSVYFGACEMHTSSDVQIYVKSASTVTCISGYSITGNSATGIHFAATDGSVFYNPSSTITIPSALTCATAFALAGRGGILYNAGSITGAGVAGTTGPRYLANLNGVIYVGGGGANYFPGNSAGSVTTGGQYA